MPPKKKDQKEKKRLTDQQRNRRQFARRRNHEGVNVVTDAKLFASFDHRPDPNFKKKKAPPKKTFPISPDVSVESISSDEEDAGQFKVPDADVNEAEKIKRMNADFDLNDVSSFEIFNNNGERIDIVNGKHVIYEEQPPPAWRPGVHEELVGNYPKMNKPPKKNNFVKKAEFKKPEPAQKIPTKPATLLEFKQSLCNTLHAASQASFKRAAIQEQIKQQSFRVFNTPVRNKINLPIRTEAKIDDQTIVKPDNFVNDRLSMFDYTPTCGNLLNDNETFDRGLTDLEFSPKLQNASTPIENKNKAPNRKTRSVPVFNISEDDSHEKSMEAQERASGSLEPIPENSISEQSTLTKDQSTLKTSMTHKQQGVSEDLVTENRSLFDSTIEKGKEVVPSHLTEVNGESDEETNMNRKAETSVTELLDSGDGEENADLNQDDSKYSKKRQRTKSPETMCQGMSTVMTMQNEPDEYELIMEMEKENAVKKRGTLQPQQRQLDRESRMSRLSVMSAASSCQESINSAMEDMSLDVLDEDTMALDHGKTQYSESRAESRNVPTGMTIYNEDPSMLPFYLADGTFEVEPTQIAQLLHVAGQKETKTWESLPKSAFDGRRVKKLGEGSYGEVFSTIWEGKPVAIKVVPFEADKNNRLYTGEYHSEIMQTSEQILPELVVMKELNQLKDMDSANSTPNFIEMIAAEIVTGDYPKGLLKAWDNYALIKESENTRPNIYSSKEQHFIVLVSANGGVALEDFVLQSENEILSILFQLTLSMIAAESVLEFEHRDLHLGNVLIDRNGVEELEYKASGHIIPLKVHGVKVNIIDFTLSRISKGLTTVYLDLEQDPGIFEGQNDPQFDVYRKMRKNCKGDWKCFERKSNLMWIEFIGNRLLEPDICPEGLLTKERTEELRQLISILGSFESCQESLLDGEFFDKFYAGYLGAVAVPAESSE